MSVPQPYASDNPLKKSADSIYVIAEIGINHNGDLAMAKQLIDVAEDAGCDAVKFQKRTINRVYTQALLDSPRESPWGTTQRAQKEGLEFNRAQYDEIDAYCKEKGITWFASAWDLEALDFLDAYQPRLAKVASTMLVDEKFLRAVASRKQYTFISTGLSEMADIEKAVAIFRELGCPFELMHCVGTYPMEEKYANLRMIETLRQRFECPVGYSGHEVGLAISYAAAALGISSLERHITLDRAAYGSDQAASVEPGGLRMLVGAIRKIPAAMGDGVKRVLPDEQKVAAKLRGHLPL